MKASHFKCLVTAGPTREYLDPVRFLSNASSGKMGYALAASAVRRGWEVDLVSGPVCLEPPAGTRVHPVVSAAEMETVCRRLFPECDLLIMCAAVADYRPAETAPRKVKKGGATIALDLEPTTDIAKALAAEKRNQICVGFAAETDRVEEYARKKLREKHLDWIVANDVSRPGSGMESDNNTVTLYSRSGDVRSFGPAPKPEVAEFILRTVIAPIERL